MEPDWSQIESSRLGDQDYGYGLNSPMIVCRALARQLSPSIPHRANHTMQRARPNTLQMLGHSRQYSE